MELVYGIIIGIAFCFLSHLMYKIFDNCFKKYYEKKLIEFVKGLKDEQ